MSTTVVMEPATTSNRRQPVRQTRTNPQRTTTLTVTAPPPEPQDVAPAEEPGFFPAITHFTDAMTALPRELIRHYTMLKEVDAKIWAPEDKLAGMLNAALKSLAPRVEQASDDIGKSQTGNEQN